MANFGRNKQEDSGSVDVIEPEASGEDAASDDTVVSEVDTPSEAEAATEDAPNLSAFYAAVDAVDTDPTNWDFSNVTAEYDKLSRKGKMQASHGLKALTFKALDDDEYPKAKTLSAASKQIGTTSSGEGTTTDPTEELVNRISGIFLAYEKLTADNQSLGDRIAAAVDAGRKDEKTIPALLAKKLVETKMGRKPREGGGTRHNVGKHISQVFANVADGETLTLKQLSDAKSEEYGDDVAAVASIETHLKSGKFDQPGLEIVTQSVEKDGETKTKVIGVRKVALPEA